MTKHYPLHHEDASPMYKKIAADEYKRLKARIAELERMDTEHTLHIAKMNGYIHHLEEERRWRKFSEEKPEHHQDILCYCPRAKFCKVALRRWDEGTKFDVFKQELYTHWRPMPEEPKENDDARKD